MRIVIDAQLVQAYYTEEVVGRGPQYSDRAAVAFSYLGSRDRCYLDDENHIETEWQSLVPPEWFNAWMIDMIDRGCTAYIAAADCRQCIRGIKQQFGFPGGRDSWYIKTARAVAVRFDELAVIVSEDMHLHEPAAGRSARRDRILRNCEGRLARHLERTESISVRCLAAFASSGP